MFEQKTFEKYRSIEEEKFKNYAFIGRSYFDAPEGQDFFGKLISSTRWAVLGGMILGAVNVLDKPFSPTIGGMVFRMSRGVVPLVFMTTSFTTAVYIATNLRKADDYGNYVLGGLAAATAFGACTKNVSAALALAPVFGFLGGAIKFDIENSRPIVFRGFSPYWRKKLDFSIVPEKEGSWKPAPK